MEEIRWAKKAFAASLDSSELQTFDSIIFSLGTQLA